MLTEDVLFKEHAEHAEVPDMETIAESCLLSSFRAKKIAYHSTWN